MNTCNTCACNGVCDHNVNGFETCGNWIPKWISVEERLPDDSADVNLSTRSRIVGTGFYDKYTKNWVQYYSGGSVYVDVTHWMPLPTLPKEEAC